MQIKATVPLNEKNKKALGGKALAESFNVNIPDTIEGMVKVFGNDVCRDRLRKMLIIDYQATARNKMVKKEEGVIVGVGLKGAALQAEIDKYKPSVKKPGKSLVEKFREKAKTMSDEERRALLAELQGTGGAKSASAPKRAAAPVRRATA